MNKVFVGALTVMLLMVSGCAASGSAGPHPRPRTPTPAAAARLTHARPTSQQSPPPASPTAQPWGSCGNIRDEDDARDLVMSGDADALVVADVDGSAVRSYRVLSGSVATLASVQISAPRGRYLILLGAASSEPYAAFGSYGMYRLVGAHAYQLCAPDPHPMQRSGVTRTARIIDLLRAALRK